MPDEDLVPFWVRYAHLIREFAVIAGLSLFLGLYYKLPPYRHFFNTLGHPVVKGILTVYSQVSTIVFRMTGANWGLVSWPTDQDFLFRVQLATYVNARKAEPLLDIAMNPRHPLQRREMAINSLLKFEATSDWIQPFMNELSKGGLIDLDRQSPVLNKLFEKIREEGGIRNLLVRAYAEVVFSFLLQSVQEDVRIKSLGWVGDVMAEDAIFLLVPRLSREESEGVRDGIDQALLNIRAISDGERAKEQLVPFFNRSPWPGMKFPLGVILFRLGYDKAGMFLRNFESKNAFTRDEEVFLRVALAGTPYPKELTITDKAEILARERKEARLVQYASALKKQQQVLREQRLALLAVSPPVKKPGTAVAQASPVKQGTPVPPRLAMLMKETPETPIVKPQKRVKPAPKKEVKESVPAPQGNVIEEVPAEETAPETQTPEENVQVASLPKEMPPEVPPPPPPPSTMPGTSMKGVDVYFEVKKKEVPLYMNPGGDHPTGEVLDVGSKGRADFEVQIEDSKWLQVKSKGKVGWINGALVSAFNLTPEVAEIGGGGAGVSGMKSSMDQGRREEATYFEPIGEGVKIYSQPKEKAKSTGILKDGAVYLALNSSKVGPDRWFELELEDKSKGWVEGINLRLADVVQAKIKKAAEEAAAMDSVKSAFKPEWVVAGVTGVLVYATPELSAKQFNKISPPTIFQVTETLENEYGEWYRIDMGGKKGWVQAMDVNLTKR